jgi:hypothetical protein
VSEAAELPLFRARSAIRGLVKAGMLEQRGEFYVMTAEGRKKLSVQKEF